ncbi:heterokaryon incompatibility protein-domain-containing protein [Podospora didyma]|uniref:Heterokaryon incompatibility protein-domain-containing protein n=1 Tax=Podospora didyma TaxID=330526 RepID=A0AAE0U3P6_9PEZI|nr:heterokaryon incompatibility protein-domain-containing protein [Podospora didyma]
MAACTEFCQWLLDIRLWDGMLPSHDDLAAQLQLRSLDGGELGGDLGAWGDVQQRQDCPFCRLVVAAVSDERNIDPHQPIGVRLLADELAFGLSYPFPDDIRLQFVRPDNARATPTAGRIADWLQSCDRDHGNCSHTSNLAPQPVEQKAPSHDSLVMIKVEKFKCRFRVIDVNLGCVKPASLGERYVALSYVCNLPSMFRSTKDQIDALSARGSLDSILTSLPNTIRDAIDLVKAIGESYLWVDSLCLAHDDTYDRRLGIGVMNSVYQGAYFTIVAASGADANAGLPGLRPGTRQTGQRHTAELGPGLKIAAHRSLGWHLSKSPYNTRGWTLQELVLSRRAVVFHGSHISFRCQQAEWSEDSWAGRLTTSATRGKLGADYICSTPDPLHGVLPCLSAYMELTEQYSRRALRRDGDALNAFYAVNRVLRTGMESPQIEGLPAFYANAFLLFISPNGNLRRRPKFASFSWAGWEGEIHWPRENLIWYGEDGEPPTEEPSNILRWLMRNELAEWNSFSGNQNRARLLRLFRTRWIRMNEYEPSHLVELMQEYGHLFSQETIEARSKHSRWDRSSSDGGMHNWAEEVSKLDTTTSGTDSRLKKKSFSQTLLNLCNGQAEFDRLVAKMDLDHEPNMRGIRSWIAMTMWREFLSLSVSQGRKHKAAVIWGDDCGDDAETDDDDSRIAAWVKNVAKETGVEPSTLEAPKFPKYSVLQTWAICLQLILGEAPPSEHGTTTRQLQSGSGGLVGSLHPDNAGTTGDSAVDLVVLSRGQTPVAGSALFGCYQQKPPSGQPWDLLWVLCVEWRDGIAWRRGVGQILTSALEGALKPGPDVRLVFLG